MTVLDLNRLMPVGTRTIRLWETAGPVPAEVAQWIQQRWQAANDAAQSLAQGDDEVVELPLYSTEETCRAATGFTVREWESIVRQACAILSAATRRFSVISAA